MSGTALGRAEAALATPLPISQVIPLLLERLVRAGSAVLVSPPGTGKTTLVPLALADRVAGRVLVAEPRRVAARAAARRMAALLGEEVGATVGYTVRGERRVGPATRVEVLTTGVLVQRLQRDAELPGVGAVILDECHERHLDTDLALAFAIEARAALRPDLLLLATSATAEAERLAAVLGGCGSADARDGEGDGVQYGHGDGVHDGHGDGVQYGHGDGVHDGHGDGVHDGHGDGVQYGHGDGVQDGSGNGTPAPVIGADAPLFDVEALWCPPAGPVDPPRGLRVDPRLLDHVASVVRRALAESPGDVLVFLPGTGEINAVAQRLGGAAHRGEGRDGDATGVQVLRLHGRLPAGEQDAVLRPGRAGGPRRVVLATAVAESSLTVPGVRIVVDAGLAREPRTDLARGLGSLVTVRVSRAGARQRAGRAGREAPGRVYRCWSAAEQDRLPAQPEPEIAIGDLTGFALALARWGDPDGTGLALLDAAPSAAMSVARQTLQVLGAVDEAGRITPRGLRLADVGVHPRLARALLDGAPLVGARRAAELVAILADESLSPGTDDLARARARLRSGTDAGATARWREETHRLHHSLNHPDPPPTLAPTPETTPDPTPDPLGLRGVSPHLEGHPPARTGEVRGSGEGGGGARGGARVPDDLAAGIVAGLAYPERLARARGVRAGGTGASGGSAGTGSWGSAGSGGAGGAGGYLMAVGTAAEAAPDSSLSGVPWLAVAVAQRQAGAPAARIRLAAAIDEASAREVGAALLSTGQEVRWAGGDVVAREVEKLGAIVLAERPLREPPRDLVDAALREGLRREGLSLLRWTPNAVALRSRLAFCRSALGEPWPAMGDADLLAGLDRWLGPDLRRARRRAELAAADLVTALRRLLDHRLAAVLDQVAPERIAVPSGSWVRVGYSENFTEPDTPVLAVKLQEVFGWARTPVVGADRGRGGVPVVLHLLSPAGRPVAVTSDLESFWSGAYPSVRSELRGRYPRHPWPDDPRTAVPTRRVSPRRIGRT